MYNYLQKIFNKFIKEKLDKYFSTYEEGFYDLEDSNFKNCSFSKEEFLKKFIEPYLNLSFTEKQKIAEIQSKLSYPYLKEHCKFAIEKPKYLRKFNACLWTIAQMYAMNKHLKLNFDYDDESIWDIEMNEYLEIPYNQCHYCGKPDMDVMKHKFNKKKKYCHTKDCTKDETNEYLHSENCCYRKFRIRQKLFRELLNKISSGKTKEYREFNTQQRKELITEKFLSFCEAIYQQNLKIDYTIQKEDRPAELLS